MPNDPMPPTPTLDVRPPAGLQTRLMPLSVPATVDQEQRTVEVVFSTGARVRRRPFFGEEYDEELEISAAAVDLSRLNASAPVLDTHRAFGLDAQIGVVERAWIEGGEARALLRLSPRAELDGLWQDIAAGIVRNVSVGYAVEKWRITEAAGQPPLYRAVRWQPMEISFVPVPADAGAQTRSSAGSDPALTPPAPRQEESPMHDIETTAVPPAPTAAIDETAVRAAAQKAERERIAEIRRHGTAAGSADALLERLIDDGVDLATARAQILDDLAARARANPTRPTRIEIVDDSEVEHRRNHMVDAILHRAAPHANKLTEGGRRFRGLSLLELGRCCLEAAGVRTAGMTPMELASMALNIPMDGVRGHSSSDFPLILADSAGKTLRRAYEMAPRTYQPWTRAATAPDFKNVKRLQMGESPTLLEVKESGEISFGTATEGREQYALATYARRIAVTRKAIINDDLNAFARIPEGFGMQAAKLESDVVYAILTANAPLADGVALFHSSHSNLAASGGAISVTTVGAGRAAMRGQKGLDGATPLNLYPSFLLVPAAKETVAEQFIATNLYAATQDNINVFAGRLQVIVEPRLDAHSTTAWYLIANPAMVDTVEVLHLEGQEGVRIESRVGWEVEGLEIKAVLDVAAKAIDHRGLYKNAGA